MKKLLLILSVVAVLAACNTKEKTDANREMVILQDSSALYQNNIQSDKAPVIEDEKAIVEAPVATKKIVRNAPKRRQPTYTSIPRNNAPVEERYEKPVANTPPVVAPKETSAGTTTAKTETGATGTSGSTGTTETASTTTVPEKKGISKAAKGAIIGAGAGAVAGAILGKGGKGAIIGAVLGAGGGYVLGRKQDKKDGRIE